MDQEDEVVTHQPEAPESNTMTLTVTGALARKLRLMAQDEGMTQEELVRELLAEGVTLRAWEIIEGKGAMRGIHPGQQQTQGGPSQGQRPHHRPQGGGHNRNNHQRRGGGGFQGNGNRAPRGQGGGNWMEDRASFLEYVRNQEPRQR